MLSLLLSVVATIIGAVLGIILAVRAKKITPTAVTSLDKLTTVTNILLIIPYISAAPTLWFIALFSEAYHEGFLGFLGWIVCGIIWFVPFFLGFGLGLSVFWRKSGHSVRAFVAQFAGLAAIAVSFTLYAVFVGLLLTPLN